MPVSSAKIGIIYPPPEVRSIVDKTASFVARNGPEFEEKIRQNEISNSKFNFLNPNDPYHAYYQHKVREIEEAAKHPPSEAPAAPAAPTPAAPAAAAPAQPAATTATAKTPAEAPPQSSLNSNLQKMTLSSKTQDTQSRIMEQIIIPKGPPADYEFLLDAPTTMPRDLEIMKLTAQFMARNGKQFVTALMNKEQRNPLFDFLKPQHSHYSYFTKLVEQYSKILLPPKDLVEKLRKEIESPFGVLKDLAYRVEWERIQQREKAREEEAAEKERIAYAQIDWHDFVIVETVDYQPNEVGNFPPPTTPADVGARVIAQERIESGDVGLVDITGRVLIDRIIEDEARVEISALSAQQAEASGEQMADKNTDEVAMDEDSDEERPKETAPPVKPPQMLRPDLPVVPNPDNVIIRKDYDPKAKTGAGGVIQAAPAKAKVEYFKSPLTGELIPADKLSEHMRISMLNPQWLEQQQKEKKEREEQEEVLAGGQFIEANLKRMAEYRSDVFGRGAEEVVIGRKVGDADERRKEAESASWDGHNSSSSTASKRAMTGISLEEQIKAIHQSQGLVEDEASAAAAAASKIGPAIVQQQQQQASRGAPSGYAYQVPPVAPPPPRSVVQPPLPPPPLVAPPPPPSMPAEEEPSAKRFKTEEQLIPEAEYLAQFGARGPVTFAIQVPIVAEKPEWNLNGQLVHLSMPLTEQVSSIKNKLTDLLTMPASKQKLQLDGMFIKDTNSLAFYNVSVDSIIQLQLKDRGGRKK